MSEKLFSVNEDLSIKLTEEGIRQLEETAGTKLTLEMITKIEVTAKERIEEQLKKVGL